MSKPVYFFIVGLILFLFPVSRIHAVIYDEEAMSRIKDPVERRSLGRLFGSYDPMAQSDQGPLFKDLKSVQGPWEEIPGSRLEGPTHAVNAVQHRLYVNTSQHGQVEMVLVSYPKDGPITGDGKAMLSYHRMSMVDAGNGEFGLKVTERSVHLGNAELLRSGSGLLKHEKILDYPVITRCVDAQCLRQVDGAAGSAHATQSVEIVFIGDIDRPAVSRSGVMEGDLALSELRTLLRPWRNVLGSQSAIGSSEGALTRNAEMMLKGRYVGRAEIMSLFRTTLHIFH